MIARATAAAAPPTPEDSGRHRKLVDAAQQFEAMFLQLMLKTPDDGSEQAGADESGAGKSYKDFGTEAVAKAIATAGGLGVGRQIVAEVERSAVPHGISERKPGTALKSLRAAPIEVSRRLL